MWPAAFWNRDFRCTHDCWLTMNPSSETPREHNVLCKIIIMSQRQIIPISAKCPEHWSRLSHFILGVIGNIVRLFCFVLCCAYLKWDKRKTKNVRNYIHPKYITSSSRKTTNKFIIFNTRWNIVTYCPVFIIFPKHEANLKWKKNTTKLPKQYQMAVRIP